MLEAIDVFVGRHPDLSRGRTDRRLLSTLSKMSVQLREEAKRRQYDISEMKLKRSKFALACSTHDNPENVEVSCAAGVDANISRLLMQAAAEKGTEAIVLLGQWQEYKYPLAFFVLTVRCLKCSMSTLVGTRQTCSNWLQWPLITSCLPSRVISSRML